MHDRIKKTEDDIDNLNRVVSTLSTTVVSINDSLMKMVDACSALSKKIYLLENDIQDKKIMHVIKKTLWSLYPVFIVFIMLMGNFDHHKLTELVKDVQDLMQPV